MLSKIQRDQLRQAVEQGHQVMTLDILFELFYTCNIWEERAKMGIKSEEPMETSFLSQEDEEGWMKVEDCGIFMEPNDWRELVEG